MTRWIAALDLAQPDEAQAKLWNRYFRRLVGLARQKLGDSPRRMADEEDVAVIALASFFQGKRKGKYPDLYDRDDLWSLLAKITACKVVDQQRRATAQRRGGKDVHFNAPPPESSREGLAWLDAAIDDELEPDMLAAMNEQWDHLFTLLDDDELRTIARLRLEGWTNAEIAKEIGVIERTVSRRVGLIRSIWGVACDVPIP